MKQKEICKECEENKETSQTAELTCLECGGIEFVEKEVSSIAKVKGEKIEAVSPAFVCSNCEASLMNSKQLNQLRRAAVDTYRKKNGLLTSKEIVAYRKQLEMTQEEFASYLGVGITSVKRWETTQVQDKANDELMRLKCNQKTANDNVIYLTNRLKSVQESKRTSQKGDVELEYG